MRVIVSFLVLIHLIEDRGNVKVSKKPHKILVVDDDPVIRDMMMDILDFEGYPTQAARNGREALDILCGDEGYLVFLDLMMPVMDGRELCLVLNADPRCRERHVLIMMSAMDNLSEAVTLSADATMPKPFSVEDVLGVVNRWFEVVEQ